MTLMDANRILLPGQALSRKIKPLVRRTHAYIAVIAWYIYYCEMIRPHTEGVHGTPFDARLIWRLCIVVRLSVNV